MKSKLLLVSFILSVQLSYAQGYKIGDVVGNFNLKGTDGKMHSLPTGNEIKGAIVVFTSNHCPFSIAYEDRIIALHKKYASMGYPVIAINPNDEVKQPEDSYRFMKKKSKEKNFPFHYLHDENQETAKLFGATRTPHVFITSKNINGEHVLMYIGAIDNNTDNPEVADKKYVEMAVEELRIGKDVSVPNTKAIGCSIKWKAK
jgi:thiol-disulfide isomerase/thioredoxin